MNTQSSPPASGPAPASGPSGPAGADFFDRIRGLGVVRPDEGRWAAGVCAGLARRWGLDPLLVRGLFVAVSIVGGFGLSLYGVLWLLLPHPDGRIHAQQVMRGVVTGGFIGSASLLLIGLPVRGGAFGWNGAGFGFAPFSGLAFLALIGFGIWWLVTRGSRHPGGPGGNGPGPQAAGEGPTSRQATGGYESLPVHPSSDYSSPGYESSGYGASGYESSGYGASEYGSGGPGPAAFGEAHAIQPRWSPSTAPGRPGARPDLHAPSHAITRSTLGLALLAAAAVLAWGRFGPGLAGPAGLIAAAVALGVISLGLLVAGARGRRGGGLAPIAVLLALTTAAGAMANTVADRSYGQQTWTPVQASVAENGYRLGAGRAVLDLTRPALVSEATAVSPVTVPVNVGAGELIVILPPTTATDVTADVGLGDITDTVGSQGDRGGPGASMHVTTGGPPVLVVTVKLGVGHIDIVPQGAEVQR